MSYQTLRVPIDDSLLLVVGIRHSQMQGQTRKKTKANSRITPGLARMFIVQVGFIYLHGELVNSSVITISVSVVFFL